MSDTGQTLEDMLDAATASASGASGASPDKRQPKLVRSLSPPSAEARRARKCFLAAAVRLEAKRLGFYASFQAEVGRRLSAVLNDSDKQDALKQDVKGRALKCVRDAAFTRLSFLPRAILLCLL